MNNLVWWFVRPSHLLLFAVAAAAVLVVRRPGRRSHWVLGAAVTALLAAAFSPLADWLARPLEERFAPPPAQARPYGIIVLAGAEQTGLYAARGEPQFDARADRLTSFLLLAQRFPDARLVHAGRGGERGNPPQTQSTTAAALLDAALPGRTVLYEDRSRNTWEAARELRALLPPAERAGPWWLVTSAMHMPRAVGAFRAEGIDVIAWPTDYATGGGGGGLPGAVGKLETLDFAAHEWVGLAWYRLHGRIEEPFPKPATSAPPR